MLWTVRVCVWVGGPVKPCNIDRRFWEVCAMAVPSFGLQQQFRSFRDGHLRLNPGLHIILQLT
jgi:hypothetical protein